MERPIFMPGMPSPPAPFPRIASVEALADWRLLVEFRNGVRKVYDCAPLLSLEAFQPLINQSLFNAVCVEPDGYAVVWNDEIDLAEAELWTNGKSLAGRVRDATKI